MNFLNGERQANSQQFKKTGEYLNTLKYKSYLSFCVDYRLQVGDGCTAKYYTDRSAYTVIERIGSTVTVQRDKAIRLTTPLFVPGGFAGHCTNQHEIKYRYERNPNGAMQIFTRRKNGKWIARYQHMKGGTELVPGRHEFYDYNF